MLHGKKGFQRIVWAFKNVLNSAVTWLFHDLEKSTNSPDDGTVVPAQFGGCGGMFQAWKSNGPYRTFASANPEASSDPEDLCPTGIQISVCSSSTTRPARTRIRRAP